VTRAAVAIAIGMLSSPSIQAQSYEVASIKPADPSLGRSVIIVPRDNSTITIRGMSLKNLIQFTYGHQQALLPGMVSGGPAWYDQLRFDIVAKPEGGQIPSREQHRQMLKALLAERFKLTVHRESKEATVVALALGKNGPKLKERKPGDGGEPHSILPRSNVPEGRMRLSCRDTSMAAFASFLESTVLSRTVVDQTGLPGTYDFDLNWSPDENQFDGRYKGAPQSDLPDLFAAIRDQLGLRLETAKAPVEIIVVDHAEKPAENE